MSAARDPYVKVYYGIADDARFEHVFGNDAALAWWLRLLLIADGTWPASAHIPAACKPKALHSLVEAGLIELMGNHRFRVHGMDAERAKRSEHASQASRSRWSSNAASIPVSKPPSNATTTAPSNPQNMPTNSDELRRTQKAPPTPPTSEPRLTQRQLDSWRSFTSPKWQPFKEAWMRRGFGFAPFGTDGDDDTSQRGLLWQIADARPHDLGHWVRAAPAGGPREVIDYVLAKWHDAREAAGVEDDAWQETKREDRRQSGRAMTRIGAVIGNVDGDAA